jgi:hypothetical protein
MLVSPLAATPPALSTLMDWLMTHPHRPSGRTSLILFPKCSGWFWVWRESVGAVVNVLALRRRTLPTGRCHGKKRKRARDLCQRLRTQLCCDSADGSVASTGHNRLFVFSDSLTGDCAYLLSRGNNYLRMHPGRAEHCSDFGPCFAWVPRRAAGPGIEDDEHSEEAFGVQRAVNLLFLALQVTGPYPQCQPVPSRVV